MKSWAKLYAQFLVDQKQDPENFILVFPNRREANFLKTESDYNWEFKS